MPARPLRDRLMFNLESIRKELGEEVARFSAEEYDWVPAEGMKPCKDQLTEIGTMETLCAGLLLGKGEQDWSTVWGAIAARATSGAEAMKVLSEIRDATYGYLKRASDSDLLNPVALPESWHQYFGGPEVEPEELLRWVAMHEYYHMGQLIAYRWIRGDNPYKRG